MDDKEKTGDHEPVWPNTDAPNGTETIDGDYIWVTILDDQLSNGKILK